MTTALDGFQYSDKENIMCANFNEVFGRINNDGNVDILYISDGEKVTRLNVDGVYPVNSLFSTRCDEHSNGIVLTIEQCQMLNIEIE